MVRSRVVPFSFGFKHLQRGGSEKARLKRYGHLRRCYHPFRARLDSRPRLPYNAAMLSRTPPVRFIAPCLPSPADQPPTGPN
jgi:hypothetical protein